MLKLNKQISLLLLFFVLASTALCQPVLDPDPQRFENEIHAFADWDKKNSTPENPILFVGSSSIRLWHTATAFPGHTIINRGFGGSHTSDVLYYYDVLIAKYQPSLIITYVGENDIASGKPVEQVFADYQELVNRILDDFPSARFLFIPLKPSSSRWDYWETMQELNRQIRNLNLDNERLHYIDLATPLLREDNKPNDSYFIDDLLHLNDQGYQVWNRHLRPVLEELSPVD